jgi:hypothetical protein
MTTRWFVEVSPFDADTLQERYCVEAPQWQQALQQARKIRGDRGPLSRFTIEVVDLGYRATDPSVKLRYTVSKAPMDAPLTSGMRANGASVQHAAGSKTAVPAPGENGATVDAPRSAPHFAATERAMPAVESSAGNVPIAVLETHAAPAAPPPAPPPAPPAVGPRAHLATAVTAPSMASPVAPRPSAPVITVNEPPKKAPDSPPSVAQGSSRSIATSEPAKNAAGSPPVVPRASSPGVAIHEAGRKAPGSPPVVPRASSPGVAIDEPAKKGPDSPSVVVELVHPPEAKPAKAPGQAPAPAPAVEVPGEAAHARGPEPAPSTSGEAEPSGEEGVPSLPGLTLIAARREEPTAKIPITYREFAFAVAPGLSPRELERYARAAWEQVRTSLAARRSGKFVQIAIFDHAYGERPERPPLAVLAWKDWRGDPVLQIRGAAPKPAPEPARESPPEHPVVAVAPVVPIEAPAHAAPLAAPAVAAPAGPIAVAPAAAVAPPPVAAVPATAVVAPEPAVTSAPVAPAAGAFPAPQGAPPAANPIAEGAATKAAAIPLQRARTSVRPFAPVETATGRRGPTEDLISELFEEMHQLHFMPDIVTGAEYVLNVLSRVLPCQGVLVHVFDINTRQFVVVRAIGPGAREVLLHRTPDTFPLFREAFRRARALSFPAASNEEAYRNGRFERLGVAVNVALCGAVQQGGRYLGILELVNPVGGEPFHDSELNAVDYICEQFADFVASRPIVLDDDAVVPRS